MSDEMFEYIKKDTTGFEEKIKKAWKFYKNDIKKWTENFNEILKKYYKDKNQIELKIDTVENKNIKKMETLYQKKILDPMNMFMLINSTHENIRYKVINELLGKEDKEYNFLGVPYYGQTPAITREFTVTDIGDISSKPDGVNNLEKLAKRACSISDISEETLKVEKLKILLEEVCKKHCKNGIAKITSALYYINSQNFVPVNKYTAELFDIPIKYDEKNDFIEKYLKLCMDIKKDEKKLDGDNKGIMLFPLISSYAFYSKNMIAETIESFSNTRNVVLTGAPGTGKTYSVKQYLKSKLGDNYESRVCFMQFHPSIDYIDFIEGIKPSAINDGSLNVELQNGVFKEFCKKAFNEPKENFYFVIDEINRANLSTVFGEILNVIEYRIKFDNESSIKNPEDFIDTQNTYLIRDMKDVAKQKELSVCEEYIGKFGVPENLYILATMNNIDKSIDSFDLALRRRFIWIEMPFDENVIRFEVKINPEKLVQKAKKLNKKVVELLRSKSYEIGHAYFLKIENYENDENSYSFLWSYHLEPLLREYLRAEFADADIDDRLADLKKEFI